MRSLAATGVKKVVANVVVLLASSVVLVGCLVTDKIEFQEENQYPPSIESRPMAEHPLGVPITVDLRDGSDAPNELLLEVYVRDPDIYQTLERKVYIGNDCQTIEQPDIPPNPSPNDPTVRSVDQRVGISNLGTGTENRCVRIQMRVSGAFVSASPQPVKDGDLATASWFVFVHETDPFLVSPEQCTSSSIDEICATN